jgi:prolyl-tRNA editing enzyme YbaK/EbsC (Cys-tRNA(Pro) deacylase)
MAEILGNGSVLRVAEALERLGFTGSIRLLSESARSAREAAESLEVEVGQIASSIVFRLPDGSPLLVITSGRHRVDVDLVANGLQVEKLHRADAEYVRLNSGFAIGGVAPVGWSQPATVIIDEALGGYEVIWAAAGHPHAVFPTTYEELVSATKAQPMIVAEH